MSEISIKGKTFYDKISRLWQNCWGTSEEPVDKLAKDELATFVAYVL